jgi:D-sedoheptulose 7-phosphate isomerase
MNYIETILKDEPILASVKNDIERLLEILLNAAKKKNTIFLCGNGGSSSDADHISGELLKSFIIKRKVDSETSRKLFEAYGEEGLSLASKLEGGIKSIPMSVFSAFLSAYGNDVDWKMAYAQLLYVMGEKGDVLIGISCSGNAENVYNAFKIASVKGIFRVLLTGENGGKCLQHADLAIKVPLKETYKIQEWHSKIYHAFCADLEKHIFGI